MMYGGKAIPYMGASFENFLNKKKKKKKKIGK
jgi:hypothetical protein